MSATSTNAAPAVSASRITLAYGVMLAAAVVIFWGIRSWGESFASGGAPVVSGVSTSPATAHTFRHVLLALVAILVTARCVGWIFARLGQPRVIGEVVAGLLLGPSFLGRIWPDATAFLLPADAAPYLGVLAQLGIALYMFLVGLELNGDLLRGKAHASVAISHASIVAPFLAGAALSLGLFERYAPAGVTFTSFALFLGSAMSITALPVLARILTDRGLEKTEFGVIALGCAAADDVTAWCLLAFVVGISQAQIGAAFLTLAISGVFVAFMLLVARPMLRKWIGPNSGAVFTSSRGTWLLVALLLSAVVTDVAGVHAIFGAFLLGAIIPHDSTVASAFKSRLEDVVSSLLLPAFFAYTGLRTQIGLVGSVHEWLICAVIIAVATVGKFGGTMIAARFTGIDWRHSAALGALMNTRGLMEIIVLDLGLSLGVITPTLFAMMVLMALVTTVMTTPVLQCLGVYSTPPRASEA
jgi:Kef-type K+ transport system membrane component KefB